MKIVKEITQIEEIKLKDVKTIKELITILKQHKELFDENPSYHKIRLAGWE